MVDLGLYKEKRLLREQKKIQDANDPRKVVSKNINKRLNGCWEWTGRVSTKGYGLIYFKGRVWPAHRLSYLAFKGEFNLQLFVCHKCDNPKCVNPAHLFLGTPKENTYDSIEKGRFFKKYDKAHNPGFGVLTNKIAREVKYSILNSGLNLKQIAVQFKMPYQLVRDIKDDTNIYFSNRW